MDYKNDHIFLKVATVMPCPSTGDAKGVFSKPCRKGIFVPNFFFFFELET